MAGMHVEPTWLEDRVDKAICPVCMMVLDQPTVGCPEGHALCRDCYLESLSRKKECPVCYRPTDEVMLRRSQSLQDFVGNLRVRCKHGLEEGIPPPEAQRCNPEPVKSMSTDDVRKELEQRGMSCKGRRGRLVARLKEHRQHDTCQQAAHLCSWRGRISQLQLHLAETCGYESVECINSAMGCRESMLRKDAARHASETCEHRPSRRAPSSTLSVTRDLQENEVSCPEGQADCLNAGCGDTVASRSMAEHRGVCGREEVACPCPGCDVRGTRSEVEEHVEASGAVHLRSAWKRVVECQDAWMRVAEMEATLVEQGRQIAAQAASIAEQERTIVARTEAIISQGNVILKQTEGTPLNLDPKPYSLNSEP